MKRSRSKKNTVVLTAGLFVSIGLVGVLFLGWGEVRLAFLLLIYCLLILGLRLDEISCQLRSIDRRLAAHLGRTAPNEPGAVDALSVARDAPSSLENPQ